MEVFLGSVAWLTSSPRKRGAVYLLPFSWCISIITSNQTHCPWGWKFIVGPFPLRQMNVIIWIVIRTPLFLFLDTINVIISGIWIMIRTPLRVGLFQIMVIICDAMCVGTLHSNPNRFLIPWCIASSLLPGSVVQCLFIHGQSWRNAAFTGPNRNWMWLFTVRYLGLCGHKQKNLFLNQNHDYFQNGNAPNISNGKRMSHRVLCSTSCLYM